MGQIWVSKSNLLLRIHNDLFVQWARSNPQDVGLTYDSSNYGWNLKPCLLTLSCVYLLTSASLRELAYSCPWCRDVLLHLHCMFWSQKLPTTFPIIKWAKVSSRAFLCLILALGSKLMGILQMILFSLSRKITPFRITLWSAWICSLLLKFSTYSGRKPNVIDKFNIPFLIGLRDNIDSGFNVPFLIGFRDNIDSGFNIPFLIGLRDNIDPGFNKS